MKLFPARFIAFFILFSLASLIFHPRPAHAASFAESFIRTDRQKEHTQTTGLVCAEPATTGVENSVSIAFPTGFTVSSNRNNWTVDTTNLPNGAAAWPGVGTATAVSGQTVTFPSADLTAGTVYCFTWDNSQALETGPAGGANQTTLTTQTIGAIILDTNSFQINTVSDDQLKVSATVEPLTGSGELKIDGAPGTSTILSQDKVITVTLSYRHSLHESYPAEIIGEWDQGLIEGASNNLVDVFLYDTDSASRADDGTVPVIDPVNRTVTWHLPSLAPSEKFHQVSFRLRVRPDLPTEKKISVKVKANGRILNSLFSERSLLYTVQKDTRPSPTPTPLPPTNVQIPLKILSVAIDEIADTYLGLKFQTNKDAVFTINYGENPASLDKTVTDLTYQSKHSIKLTGLSPKTQYYFRITARDRSGKTVTSDLFTATTAASADTIKLSRDDFTVHWGKYFLLSQSMDTVVLPKEKPITLTARIGNSQNIAKIIASFTNEHVLGLNTYAPRANIGQTPLIEILPGIFSGEIESPSQKGVYSVVFEITDVNGGLYRKQAPYTFYVSDPLRVMDKKTGRPIEGAEVNITKYQESLKLFAPLENSFSVSSRTDENGNLDIVLPTGKYDIEVKAQNYKPQAQTIELGISTRDYPVFSLERQSTVQSIASYYTDSLSDLYGFTTLTTHSFFSSQRAKDLYLLFIFIMLFLLIVLDTHIKKRISLMSRLVTFSILDVFVLVSGVATLLFVTYQGVSNTALILAITIFIFIFGFIYVRRAFFRKKTK